jgi:phosphoribosylamine--glycine ligase
MKVLVVGSGGREHALCWKLLQSKRVESLFCLPGNAGISEIAACIDIKAENIEGICEFAQKENIEFVVIGPELPLSLGLVDRLEEIGVKSFGPNKECSQLEGSKSFTKAFLDRHNIPTAKYREFVDKEDCLANIGIYGYPMVIKADGLAGGKGVIIAQDENEGREAIEALMGQRVFGSSGDKIVVEEYLEGVETSALCFVDEHTILPMDSCQDYKRVFDEDQGENTGGMGSYSPNNIFNEDLWAELDSDIFKPTLKGLQEDGLNFKGILFIGLMITNDGPKVIEFNNRFGDPETQSLLPRLKNDLLEVLMASADNRLDEIKLQWDERTCITVNLVSEGYPKNPVIGRVINGLRDIDSGILVFHGATKFDGDFDINEHNNFHGNEKRSLEKKMMTTGGRVLSITGFGENPIEARANVYKNIDKISFQGMHFRRDIAY